VSALASSVWCMSTYRQMFYYATAFNQSICWDLGSGVTPSVTSTDGAVIVAGPQGSEYTDDMCVCPVEAVFEEDLGNNGACTVPTPVPTAMPSAVPTASPTVSDDTAALMALIEALQSHVVDLESTIVTMQSTESDLQSTVAAMQSVDSDVLLTVAAMQSVDSAMEKDMSDMRITAGRVVEWKRKVRQGTDKLTTRRTPRMKRNDDDTNDTNNLRRT